LLTIGILSGQFGQTKLGVLIELGPKETWALITWLYLLSICILEFLKVGPVNDQRLLLLSVIIIWIC
jgi:ABC-type transport system involved in cytochrome c biogenesis permease subunit